MSEEFPMMNTSSGEDVETNENGRADERDGTSARAGLGKRDCLGQHTGCGMLRRQAQFRSFVIGDVPGICID